MWRIAFYILLFFTPGCKKDPAVWEIKNLNGNKISVFGHGGMGESYRYPMNSYESLRDCLKKGVDGTEMDVCVSADSVLVLCHSQDLASETKCSGLIKSSSWSAIAGCKFKSVFTDASVIQASYLFDRLDKSDDKHLFTFDCKVSLEDNTAYLDLFASALMRHIDKYKLESRCYIESFNIDFLKIIQSKNKNLRLFLYTDDCQVGIEASTQVTLYGLTIDTRKISAEEIKKAHQQNLRVTVFNTSTERDNLEAIQKSPDNIQTDKVEYLLNALKN